MFRERTPQTAQHPSQATRFQLEALSPGERDKRPRTEINGKRRKVKKASCVARLDENNLLNAVSHLLDQMTHRLCRWRRRRRRSGWSGEDRQKKKGKEAVGGRHGGVIYTSMIQIFCFSKS